MANCINVDSPESMATQISPLENKVSDSSAKGTSGNTACKLSMSSDMLNTSFNITLKFLSPGASSGPFCRICHEGDNLEDLFSLCKCTGSVGLVHLTCMERWLSLRRVDGGGVDKCEICNYTFETIHSPRSLTEWYQSDQGSMSTRRSVLGDVACFSMITPLTALSSYLCLEGAKQHVLWNNSLEAGCLMALATFLITVFLIWNVLTIRYHLKNFFRWRTINQNVRLVSIRRNSSTRVANRSERNVRSTENRDSQTGLVTSSQQTPILFQTPRELPDVNTQASNVFLGTT